MEPEGDAPGTVGVKAVFVGFTGAGKTAIFSALLGKGFEGDSAPTVAAAHGSLGITAGGQAVRLDLWDTAGSERFEALNRLYYRSARVALAVFDVTSRQSFDQMGKFLAVVPEECDPTQPEDLVVAILANKTDLEETRVVSREEGEAFATSRGYIYLETSAKLGKGIDAIVPALAEALGKRPDLLVASNKEALSIQDPEDPQPSPKPGCC